MIKMTVAHLFTLGPGEVCLGIDQTAPPYLLAEDWMEDFPGICRIMIGGEILLGGGCLMLSWPNGANWWERQRYGSSHRKVPKRSSLLEAIPYVGGNDKHVS